MDCVPVLVCVLAFVLSPFRSSGRGSCAVGPVVESSSPSLLPIVLAFVSEHARSKEKYSGLPTPRAEARRQQPFNRTGSLSAAAKSGR